MYLNKANLELAALACTDAGRTNLAVLRVEPTRTIATDGHVLGIVDVPALDPKDYPAVGGLTETDAAFEACSIPVPAARALLKAIPKARHQPILRNAKVDVAASNANGTFRAVTTDLETTTPIEARKVDETFPDIAQVMPTGEPRLRVAFDAALLAHVLSTAVKMGLPGKNNAVTLEFFRDHNASKDTATPQPLKITGKTTEGQAITFLVMPCRV